MESIYNALAAMIAAAMKSGNKNTEAKKDAATLAAKVLD